MAAEEGAIVITRKEARLLAVGPPRDGEPGALGLGPRRLLVLIAQRERDPGQVLRVERGEHVALILGGVRGAGEQGRAVALDDPRVVTGREPLRSRPPGEREQ